MPEVRARSINEHAPAACILLIALLATWFAYSPGVTGSFYFDDPGSLGGLAFVDDQLSALTYVLSGTAGPLGRPLALASFVPEASAWPTAPEVFLRTNILIHLLNGALVAWFLYLLGIARLQSERHAAMVAAGSGAIWMVMPILASSSFLVVQRMTTLSAVFMLLGAIAYLYARRVIESRPLSGAIGMSLALVLGVLLAAFTKENGVLLFVFILAMEATLLRRPSGISSNLWRSWLLAVLILPSAAIFAYLAVQIPYPESVTLIRDFNGPERLLTQAQILWKYLFLAFAPNLPGLGPFHDAYPVQRSLMNPVALMSVFAWATVITVAVIKRRRAPVFAFAVAWYLLGHSLESTTIPLELYFEHRNYLPLVGPAYALVSVSLNIGTQWRRLFVLVMVAYSLMLAGILYSVASLWGTPAIAAEMWYIYKPGSIRAAEKLARQMEDVNEPFVARSIFREVRERHPEAHYLDLQILLISCQIERDADYNEDLRTLENRLRSTKFSHSAVEMLVTSYTLVRGNKCPGMSTEDVYRLAQSVLDNPRFYLPVLRQSINLLQAHIAIEKKDADLAMLHIKRAINLHPNPATIGFAADMLNKAGLHDAANKILGAAGARAPRHPLGAILWDAEMERLRREQRRIGDAEEAARAGKTE